MGSPSGTREIIELVEEMDSEFSFVKPGKVFCIEDEINRLFESLDISKYRNQGSSQVLRDSLQPKSLKRSMTVGLHQAEGIGITQPISLKQAFRGLCISQASEMAATKRPSKPFGFPRVSDAGTVNRLHLHGVTNVAGQPLNGGNVDLVKISVVPEGFGSKLPDKKSESQGVQKLENRSSDSSIFSRVALRRKLKITSEMERSQSRNQRLKLSEISTSPSKKLPVFDEIVPASVEKFVVSTRQDKKMDSKSYLASSMSSRKVLQPVNTGPAFIKPLFRNKNHVKKKSRLHSTSANDGSQHFCTGTGNDMGPRTTTNAGCHVSDCNMKEESSASSGTGASINVGCQDGSSSSSKLGSITDSRKKPKTMVNADQVLRLREKGDFSQSSKSSIGEYCSSTSFSYESHLSGSSQSACRPHMSHDLRWEAVRQVQKQHGSVGLKNLKLLRKLGGGDIGSVYLAELLGTNCLFALKVMDNEFLALRKKKSRAQTEREILQLLDHPFLPTLFSHFTTEKFSCLVIEYCPGGDLHVLRQKQANKTFSEQAVRFYAAEVVLALEYLHMVGVVYRDLKPENILVREDGHIMLTDFDLSLRCDPNQTLLQPFSPIDEHPKRASRLCTQQSCLHPLCFQPSWQIPCFIPRHNEKQNSDPVQSSALPQVVVEPTKVRSNSYVGTHEYLAPEIIKGDGHGSQVDWWMLGILMYELLYGRTPFKGVTNEDTLANVVSRGLNFPEIPIVSSQAKDLMKRLLRKMPENRLGSLKGATEIKKHPFFEGLNWALIRCATPPEMPQICEFRSSSTTDMTTETAESSKCEKELGSAGEHLVFEMF